jgi:hypothetical protein
MNAQYNATTGRDYYCVSPKGIEKEKYTSRIILDRRNKGFFGLFLNRRREKAKF